jgi:PPE-repeat protein
VTAVLDFAMFPPEFNSARMYSGPGSASMLAAASAWKAVAGELRATALSYGAVLSALTDEEWLGPASTAMASAAAPYVEWMNTTAVRAEQAAVQAETAAVAYETAFAATVPPPEIAANRAQLASLVSTNILGLNTPAIAANEAQYCEMWGQDAAAMYGYASTSAVATRLIKYRPPQPIVNPGATTAQSTARTQVAVNSAAGTGQSAVSKLMSSVPGTLQDMAVPTATAGAGTSLLDQLSDTTTPIGFFWNNFGLNANIWNTIFSSGFYMPSNYAGTFADFMGLQQGASGAAAGAAGGADAAAGAAEGAAAGLTRATAPLSAPAAMGSAVTAGLGAAPQVGGLTVPATWTGAAPELVSATGATRMIAPPPAVAAGMPGVPMGGSGRGYGRNVPPQYGFKPSFLTRPPSAG